MFTHQKNAALSARKSWAPWFKEMVVRDFTQADLSSFAAKQVERLRYNHGQSGVGY